MAYNEVQLKTNGGKISPFSKSFLIQNLSDRCLSNRSVLSTVPAEILNFVNVTISYKA